MRRTLIIGSLSLILLTTSCDPSTPATATGLSYELLRQTPWDVDVEAQPGPPAYPKLLRALDGQRVAIPGFMSPYNDLEDLSKFILRARPVGCRFCKVVTPVEVALVETAGETSFSAGPILVTGTLRLWTQSSKREEHGAFPFILEEASFRDLGVDETPEEIIERHENDSSDGEDEDF